MEYSEDLQAITAYPVRDQIRPIRYCPFPGAFDPTLTTYGGKLSQFVDAGENSIGEVVSRLWGFESFVFLVSPNIDTETLLANAVENLASANQMAATLAVDLVESQRSIGLGIQQLIELSSLLVDRAREQVAPATSMTTA